MRKEIISLIVFLIFAVFAVLFSILIATSGNAQVLQPLQGGTGQATSSSQKYPLAGTGGLSPLTATNTLWLQGINATSTSASSTFQGITLVNFRATGASATNTLANGIWIQGGSIRLLLSGCNGASVLETDSEGNLQCGTDAGASGVVTSVVNNDGTLTISPTTGDVIASLNLGNANVWIAGQTFNGGVQTNYSSSSVSLFASSSVKIGTTSPNHALSVNGNSLITGTSTSGALVATGTLETRGVASSTIGGGLTVKGALDVQLSSASSTFQNGLNLTAGCFAVNGVCVGSEGEGTVNSGTINRVAYYTGATTIDSATLLFTDNTALGVGTTSPALVFSVQGSSLVSGTSTAGSLRATNTLLVSGISATSSFQNALRIGTTTMVLHASSSNLVVSQDRASCCDATLVVLNPDSSGNGQARINLQAGFDTGAGTVSKGSGIIHSSSGLILENKEGDPITFYTGAQKSEQAWFAMTTSGGFWVGTTSGQTSGLSVQGNALISGNLTNASIKATGTLEVLGLSTLTGGILVNNSTSTINTLQLIKATTTNLFATSVIAIGTTTPGINTLSGLAVQGNSLFSGNLAAANIKATGTLDIVGVSTLRGGFTANADSFVTTHMVVGGSSLGLLGFYTLEAQPGTLGSFAAGNTVGLTDYLAVGNDGDLTLNGAADYVVVNRYAFRAGAASNYGLYFNNNLGRYELVDGAAGQDLFKGVDAGKLFNRGVFDNSATATFSGGSVNFGDGVGTTTIIVGKGTSDGSSTTTIPSARNSFAIATSSDTAQPIFSISSFASTTFVTSSTTNSMVSLATTTHNSLLNVGGPVSLPITKTIVATFATATDQDFAIVVDTTSAPVTLKLPTLSGRYGRLYHVVNVGGNSTNVIVVDPYADELVNGATTKDINPQDDLALGLGRCGAWLQAQQSQWVMSLEICAP